VCTERKRKEPHLYAPGEGASFAKEGKGLKKLIEGRIEKEKKVEK